jgi:hypothetical protein
MNNFSIFNKSDIKYDLFKANLIDTFTMDYNTKIIKFEKE